MSHYSKVVLTMILYTALVVFLGVWSHSILTDSLTHVTQYANNIGMTVAVVIFLIGAIIGTDILNIIDS